MAHLVGLDIGSTAIKAVRFDERGRVVVAASAVVSVSRPSERAVERDPEEVWSAATRVLRRVARRLPRTIRALGITGCGNGAIFLDGRCRPLRMGILSSDTRARDFLPDPPAQGQQAYPGQMAALLPWFRQQEPRASRRLRHVLFWKDYIRFRLTGEIATDQTDAGAGGLLRYPEGSLISADPVIPEVRSSLAIAGGVRAEVAALIGLPAKLPVFVGCIDCEAAALGSNLTSKGDVSVVAGTWSINQAWVDHPPVGAPFLINPSAIPGRWLVLEGSPTSAANFDWCTKALGLKSDFGRACNLARCAPAGGPLFVPRVLLGQGAFFGLNASQGRGAMLRAVMEGIVFGHRVHLRRLAEHIGSIQRVVLAGGAARSRFWCQLFADGLDVTVTVPRGGELGPRGAALCAGLGLGVWTDLSVAQKKFASKCDHFTPSPERTVLAEAFSRFEKISQALDRRLLEHSSLTSYS